jgi:hypothetical protein
MTFNHDKFLIMPSRLAQLCVLNHVMISGHTRA